MFAYIPARGGSKRIPRKNIRVLGGKPLLSHVIDALAGIEMLTGIAVSSDDPEILELARRHGKVTTLTPRNKALANDVATFMDLVRGDVPRFSEHFRDSNFIFVTATAALVRTSMYQEAIEMFNRDPRGLVMGVTAQSCSALLALVGQPASQITPLFPDMYAKPTKDLPRTFTDAGCFYVANLQQIIEVARFIDLEPIRGVVLPNDVGIDLDTEEDWNRLVGAYLKRQTA